MGVQDLTVQMVVIVVIGVFFASFMDAIAGGGGIISVPTYLLAESNSFAETEDPEILAARAAYTEAYKRFKVETDKQAELVRQAS